MDGWVVRNQTPCRLVLLGDDERTLELAPLQTRAVDVHPESLGPAVRQAVEDGALAWEPRPPREVREQWASVAVLLAAGACAWLGTAVYQRATVQAAVAATGLLLCLAVLALLNRLERADGHWGWRRGTSASTFNSWESARRVVQRALQTLLLLVVLAVGLAVPAAAVYYGTGLGAAWKQADWSGTGLDEQELVVRGLQVAMIALLVLVPALMYFWFDREKTETLLDRWLHHIFRFDPGLASLRDVDAKHGRRLEEAYGTFAGGVSVRSQHHARSRAPVVLATLLLALGWVLVLVNVGAEPRLPDVPEGTRVVFEVERTPVSFAFLGAYVYALQVVLRGYVRGDLRPKTYNAISVRIVVAFCLAGVAQGVLPDDDAGQAVLLTTCFLAGIVPDTVLRRLRDVGGWQARRGSPDELGDAWPLTEVTGIDLYERTRLGEEGITNVQALAHCDVVALTLNTRIPFERVVHWVDQAVLHEHVCRRDRARLRRLGITTATALLEVGTAEPDALEEAVPQLRVRLLLRALERAEWVSLLLAWRRQDPATAPEERRYPRPADGAVAVLDGAAVPVVPRPRPVRRRPAPAVAR